MAGGAHHRAKCVWNTTQFCFNPHLDDFTPIASEKGYYLLECVVLILKE